MYKDEQTDIFFLNEYYPTYHPMFEESYSNRILDLKRKSILAIDYYTAQLEGELNPVFEKCNDLCIMIVPSHDPSKIDTGIRRLALKLINDCNLIDATNCLNRYKLKDKNAFGGDRSIQGHYDTIRVVNKNIFKDKRVIIIDDVTTSGNTLIACRNLIEQAGAKKVMCIAIGKTTH